MPLRAKRMKGLRIDEASGVDAPAHLAPGWMVLKSEAGADPLGELTDEQIEALMKAAEAEEESPMPNDDLIASLTKALGTMPEAAKAQATALIGVLGGDAGAGDDPVAKAVADALTKATADALTAAEARATAAEAELAKAKGAVTETEEEALAKAMASLPEPMRKVWGEGQAKIAKAEKDAADAVEKANTEREARVSAEYLTKARGADYANLPASPEVRATILREVDEKLTKEAGAELHRILKAASHLANRGAGDFATYGGAGADVSSAAGAQSQIEKAADDLQAKDPSLDRATAIVKAADANSDLARVAQPQGGES